jgi:ABC-type multidrug transport system ATPase subunit
MIDIENVTRQFGRTTAVDHASLRVGAGESIALWGANGAGKTTLIRCVIGLLRHSGRITVGGHDVLREGKSARMLIGYVPQEIGFYDDLGVGESVSFFARLKGLSQAQTKDALEGVGLAMHADKRIRELSGGMKQRLALAIALLGDPPILVLDEVTASLDAVGREEFVSLLERLSGAGRTMLFASHRIDEVAALAGRVALMENGRIATVLSCRDFVMQQGNGAVLHLTVAPSMVGRAIESLRIEGFTPRVNGVGVLVPVGIEQKAAPFRVLADARIRVEDFEIVSAGRAELLSTEAAGEPFSSKNPVAMEIAS